MAKDKAAPDVAALEKQIAELTEKLGIAEGARSAAEKSALASAEAQGMLMQHERHEVPTGKMKKVEKLKRYKRVGHKDDGRPIMEPEFEVVEVPTYFYKIDMPPVGGVDLKINGESRFHGSVVEGTMDDIRTLKEICYRLWDHDRNIHGSDENAYRKPLERQVSARG